MPKTILLAEDDEDILDIIYYVLTDEGYEVVRSDGADALVKATANLPDLVILDHRLQTCWGADICQALKAGEKTAHIPVIMMSATMQLKETATVAGADGILEKPFDITDILSLVKRYLA